MMIRIKKESINREVVILSAEWGLFSIDIRILNIMELNFKHQGTIVKGAHANTYSGLFEENNITIKCIPVRSECTRHAAIKEWFLLKIASAAEIGPKISNHFGFDILMFEGCIEFAMETCCPIEYSNFNSDLFFWNLAIMHKLKIAHRDIKPENLMLSPSFKKPVFIDFGLSTFIREEIGTKTFTNFIGSLNFASD